jgi:LPXTG-motif cell wall-anchored protein
VSVKSFRLFVRRLAIVVVATVAGTAGILAITMTPAWAHHTTVTGDPVCDTDTGNWVITWTVKNSEWNKTARLTEASWRPDGSTMTNIAVGAFLPKPRDGVLSGVQTVTGSATSASLRVRAEWDNGFKENAHTTRVTFNGTCQEDKPKPHVVFSSACDGTVTVTLSNDADAKKNATFTVTGAGGFSQTKTVAPGGSVDVVVPASASGDITVTVPGSPNATYSWVEPDNCAPVKVSSLSNCTQLIVHVENPQGNRAKTFVITSGSTSEEFTLAGGESKEFTFPGGAGVSATVKLKGKDDGTTVTWENPGTCAPPTTTTPPLPVTGASLTSLIGIGGALVLVGGALLLVLRYRRRLGES